MGNVSEAVTVFFAAVMVAAVGYEVRRRQKKLRAIYDVLDTETKHVTAELETMIQQGTLKPYTEESWA
jgi:predicted HTH domain antitoxin